MECEILFLSLSFWGNEIGGFRRVLEVPVGRGRPNGRDSCDAFLTGLMPHSPDRHSGDRRG